MLDDGVSVSDERRMTGSCGPAKRGPTALTGIDGGRRNLEMELVRFHARPGKAREAELEALRDRLRPKGSLRAVPKTNRL